VPDGLYVYCIIGTGEARNFGASGVGRRGDPVTTIAYRDLGAVVSSVSMDRYVVGQETMLSHERVIEKVMAEHAVLPVRFYTVAPNAEEVRSLLRSRYTELRTMLRELDNKVELGLKALWKDMGQVLRDPPGNASGELSPEGSLTGGAVVRRDRVALEGKKAEIAEQVLQPLRPLAVELRLNRTYGDDMIMNAAFLVDRTREQEFDDRVERLAVQHSDAIQFKYVGPAPPYSFVNIVVRDEPGPGGIPKRGGIAG
jgi:hypothetical protein